MERRTQSSESRNFQAPTGEAPVAPQPQAKSGEFVLPPQQAERTEAFSAQQSDLGQQGQQREILHVVPRRMGRPPTPPESTPSGELYRGSLIRMLRQEKGLSLKEAEAQLGYARRSLSMMERSYAAPSEQKLQQLAELLDIPVAVLQQAPEHPRLVRKGKHATPPESTPSGELYRGSLIRMLRQEKGLSRQEVEAQLGYAPNTLSSMETNHGVPSVEKLEKLAELFGVPIAVLEQAPRHPRTIRRKGTKGVVKH